MMARKGFLPAALSLALGMFAVPVLAQDSVSLNLGGLPGDALSPWEATQQCADYVVDLAALDTSWGNEFGIAPVVKSSNSGSDFFNSLISAQSISRLHAVGVPYAADEYAVWVGQAGPGVHPSNNSDPGIIPAPGASSNQFAVTAAEFGTTDEAVDYNGVIGAVINYDPADPRRLYVHRVLVASNGNGADSNSAQFGIGAVDEWGNVMFRADSFNAPGPFPLSGVNIFGVDMLARDCGVINVINDNGAGDAAASNWIVQKQDTTANQHNTPNIGPTSVFGTPHYLGMTFDIEYVYGTANPPTYTAAHLAPGIVDQRGNAGYTTHNHACIPGTHGTVAMLGIDGTGLSDSLNLWGIDGTGAVVAGSPTALKLPAVVTDNSTLVTNLVGDNEFDHYHSQVAFRGGNAQVGMNLDQDGNLLVAGVVYEPNAFETNPLNYIAVARIGQSCVPEWTMAAYSIDEFGNFRSGKPILDGPGGNTIGVLTTMDDVTGGTPFGPSMSAPMIDSAGNVWFIAAVALDKIDDEGQPFVDTDSALIRAVYNPTTFSYELELILELANVFFGQNSGLAWEVSFMGIADSNSVDSGTAWSSNISEVAFPGAARGTVLSPEDPRTLGGLVVNLQITYDIDGDFNFNDPTSINYDDTLPADEAYQALVYIGPVGCAGTPDPPMPDPGLGDIGFGTKNRYLSFSAGSAGVQQAVRVTFDSVPGFEFAEGRAYWVQEPTEVTEASGSDGAPGPGELSMWAATLGCNPFYTDWSTYGVVDVYDAGILRGGVYGVQLINENCSLFFETSYSDPLTVVMSAVGDLAGITCTLVTCDPPQGVVDFTDVNAVVEKFKNTPGAPRKARTDLLNGTVTLPFPDRKVDFVDIAQAVDAFRGDPLSEVGPPGVDPCE
ncbi:MAG: hypothetical protein PVI86_03705 [Phycisphaerae bacterium]|jgi:hypothetical protein